jgi:hypothetical protein
MDIVFRELKFLPLIIEGKTMVQYTRRVYVNGGAHFVVPTRFTKITLLDKAPIYSTIRVYLDNPKLHPLVKPYFQGYPIREFYEIKDSEYYPGITKTPRDDTPVPCECCKIQMITESSDRDGDGDRIYGPVRTNERIQLYSLTRANDLLKPLIVE